MKYQLNVLLDTIKQLESLITWQRQDLLNKMQELLCDQNMIMGDNDLIDIINYLVLLRDCGYLNSRLSSLRDIDCLDLLKVDSGLKFSLALVGNPKTGQFELAIMTNSKYYDEQSTYIYNYGSDNQQRFLGFGTYKTVKSCLILAAYNNILQAYLGARASVLLGEFSDQQDIDKKIDNIRNAILGVSSINDIFFAINQFSNYFKLEIGVAIISIYEEIRASRSLGDLAAVDTLRVGIPFMSVDNSGDAYLKVHVFDSICQHRYLEKILDLKISILPQNFAESLYPDLSESEKNIILQQLQRGEIPDITERIIDQMIDAIANIHDRGFRHRDLKPNNILLHGSVSNLRLKIIDWGLVIDSDHIRSNTNKLLQLLGFSSDNDGYVDGKLLDGVRLKYILLLLLNKKITPPTLPLYFAPTLENINLEIIKILPNVRKLKYLKNIATLTYSAPELFNQIRSKYYANNTQSSCLAAGICKYMSKKTIMPIIEPMSQKQDIWAAGISIVEYCLCKSPALYDKNAIAFIEHNLLLREMLHPNPKLRCTTEDLRKLRAKGGRLTHPEATDVNRLYTNYLTKISHYEDELEHSKFFISPTVVFSTAAAASAVVSKKHRMDFVNS